MVVVTCGGSAEAALFVAPDGNGTNCSSSAPCGSFSAAYAKAVPGDVVEVAGGSYGSQRISAISGRSGADVVFRPAAGAAVTLAYVDVYGTNVELRDFRVSGGWYIRAGARFVTMRNLTVTGAIFVTSASDISILGGSVGPGDSKDSQIKASNTTGAPVPQNILIDGVDFHDWTRNADPTAHVECLQFGAGDGITIRNSTFRNCETQGLFMRSWGGTARIRNVVIENNWFDATTVGYYAVRISQMDGQVYDNISVRYNSGLQSFLVDAGSSTNVAFVGNVAPRSSGACSSAQRYAYNVWAGAACSTTDRHRPLRFVDAAAMNLNLRADSAAVDAGDPGSYPGTDKFGNLRFFGTAPDAGAAESSHLGDLLTARPAAPRLHFRRARNVPQWARSLARISRKAANSRSLYIVYGTSSVGDQSDMRIAVERRSASRWVRVAARSGKRIRHGSGNLVAATFRLRRAGTYRARLRPGDVVVRLR